MGLETRTEKQTAFAPKVVGTPARPDGRKDLGNRFSESAIAGERGEGLVCASDCALLPYGFGVPKTTNWVPRFSPFLREVGVCILDRLSASFFLR
jgi:hypothetical protein